MIQDKNDRYISFTGLHTVKLHYKGDNMCELYVDGEFKGIAPFVYTVRKLRQLEKRWIIENKGVKPYQFKEIKPFIDVLI